MLLMKLVWCFAHSYNIDDIVLTSSAVIFFGWSALDSEWFTYME